MDRSPLRLKLYVFPGSNSSLTGRLMLEHKGIDHKVVELPPGLHAFIMLALGFETMGVPAIKWGDRRAQGTRWISRALDELEPARPLFPADPARRKEVEEAERWGEGLQNATRRIFYAAARRNRKAFTTVMVTGWSLPMRVFLRVGAGLIIRLASGAHRASDDAAREDVALLPERLDQVDAWIEEGRLGGAELNAADFQIAVNVALLMASDDFAPLIAGRPAAALARRVVPDYGGHIGPVLPSEWLPLRGASPEPSSAPDGIAAFLRSAGIGEAKIAEVLHQERGLPAKA